MFKISIGIFIYVTLIVGCAPFGPSNYISPSSIQTAERINNHWIKPTLIPLRGDLLNTSIGKALLEPLMKPQLYRIGAYDTLNIIVWGHPDLSTLPTSSHTTFNQSNSKGGGTTNPAIVVDANGYIFYPYVGRVRVTGLTVDRVQQIITQRLSNYIRDPQVTVQVVNYRNRNIYVLGEVRNPGAQPLTDKPLTLMTAISNAGDINPNYADPTHIYLIRGSYQQPYIYWLNAKTPQALLIATRISLQEGDIVYISAAMITGWGRFISQVLPGVQASIATKGLI